MQPIRQIQPDVTEAQFTEFLKRFEGAKKYFYCDGSKSHFVTCGIGSLIDPLDGIGANKVTKLEFYETDKSKRLDSGYKRFTYLQHPKKIRQSFDTVKRHKANYLIAPSLTTLRITEQSYLALFANSELPDAKSVASHFFSGLPYGSKYSTFADLPVNVRWALIDMAFNLGPTKLAKYVTLKKLLAAGDFTKAAKESHRKGIQDVRNNTIYNWIFYSQAKSEKKDHFLLRSGLLP